MNTKSAEDVIEGREKVDQGLVASTHIYSRGLRCQRYIQTESE